MSDEPDIRVGVWRALWSLKDAKVKQVLWPEGLPSIVIGVGGGVLLIRASAVATRVSAASTVVIIASALLAVTFTALAIIVALPSSRYLSAMGEGDDGMRPFLDPFLIAVGVELGVILLGLGYGLFAKHVAPWIEHGAFCLLALLFVYGLLDVAALARALAKHGIVRAWDAQHEPADGVAPEGGEVKSLRRR